MAFLPDGTMFFTEKCHGLSVRQSGGTVVKLLGMKDAKGYASSAGDLFCEGQAGMAGVAVAVAVAVDPNFASNRFVYVYSTSSLAAPGSNRVMRLKGNDNATAVSDRTDIVTDIPYKPRASDHPFGGPGAHNGGASPLQPRRRLSLRDHRRHAQRRSASKPDPHRRQGSAHRPQRQGRPGQWRASGLRLSGLHLWAHRNPRASRSGQVPTSRTPPKTGLGTPTKSRHSCLEETLAGTRAPTSGVVGPALTATAATAPIRWVRWIRRKGGRSCR